MDKLKISLIAFPGAPREVFERGEKILQSKLNTVEYLITDKDPDMIFILTGGSENHAKALIENSKTIFILALTENNSFAASTEIKAYCNQNNIDSVLYNIDIEERIEDKMKYFAACKNAIEHLKNYKIGLIGNVSEWLIASDVDKNLIKNKMGMQLQKIHWNDYPDFREYAVNKEFKYHFNESDFNLDDSSKIYNLLSQISSQKELDAITVECFPLVKEHAVTACLALSKFNTDGLPAGCEGDITSIICKTIVKELTGQIPWMANMVSVKNEEIFLAHCTIATNLVKSYEIKTHFETDLGTAIQGEYNQDTVTIFRLDNELNKAFVALGEIIERPTKQDACRTQISVKLTSAYTDKLKEDPLGNHHLVLAGDYTELLNFYCKLMKIEVV
ncbi:MAG: hypothetical protein C0597_03325 [Marinilabiliales bacterium]|nr:MAG: hypothetical protein C0597_03325 [Marinilabiliales bacterium]